MKKDFPLTFKSITFTSFKDLLMKREKNKYIASRMKILLKEI